MNSESTVFFLIVLFFVFVLSCSQDDSNPSQSGVSDTTFFLAGLSGKEWEFPVEQFDRIRSAFEDTHEYCKPDIPQYSDSIHIFNTTYTFFQDGTVLYDGRYAKDGTDTYGCDGADYLSGTWSITPDFINPESEYPLLQLDYYTSLRDSSYLYVPATYRLYVLNEDTLAIGVPIPLFFNSYFTYVRLAPGKN